MPPDAIADKISSFPRWHYQFDLNGHVTPIHPPSRANSHEQRKRYFFDPLVELCGGSLRGQRVLDLGCNAGYWSLEAIERGADFVLGIDGRQMHIDQANFVFDVKGVAKDRYDFRLSNIFDFDYESWGAFDVVLCLGLLYHISKPVELIEQIAAVNDDILVIDTMLSVAPGSYVRVRSEDVDNPLHSVDRELVMSPTKKAVVDMAEAFGYSVAVLKPEFTDYTAARKYRQGRRKAFLCAKKSPIADLSASVERVDLVGDLRSYGWLAADGARMAAERVRSKIARR